MPDPGHSFPQDFGDVVIAAGRIKWNAAVAASNASNFSATIKVPVTLPNGTTVYLGASASY